MGMTHNGSNPDRSRTPRGFAVAEVIIVGIVLTLLAVLVVPRLTHAANTKQEQSIRETLHHLRTQITLYRAEHGGLAPGFREGDPTAMPTYAAFVAQMTQHTNAFGETSKTPSDEFKFGPYLDQIPENPVNKNKDVRLVEAGQIITGAASGDYGWIYQPATGAIVANIEGSDKRGIPYMDY